MNAEKLITTLLQAKVTDEEVIAFLPLLLKSTGTKLEPAISAALFTRIGELIGAKPADKDEELQKKLQTYYRDHPPPVALQRAVKGFFEQQSGSKTADGFESAVTKSRLTANQVELSPMLSQHKERK